MAAIAHDFRVGDRVRANQTSGFHKGAHGAVVEAPPGALTHLNCVWVLRDGAGTPVWFHVLELDHSPARQPSQAAGPSVDEWRLLRRAEALVGADRRHWGLVDAGHLARAIRRVVREEDGK